MVYCTQASTLRYPVGVALLAASLMVVLPVAPLSAEPPPQSIRALQRYPYLADFFAYGFWHPQAPYDARLAGEFREPSYATRRDKLLHHFARHHVNIVITANSPATADSLAAAGRYGIGQVSSAGFLHSYVNAAGELTGETTIEQELRNLADHVATVRDHPHLVGYLVFDEPRPVVAPWIRQFTAAARRADPQHPPIYTQSEVSLPLDRLKHPAEWQLIQEQDVLLSDCYALAAHSGRDPWLYGDVFIPDVRRANPDGLKWPIVQAFSKPHAFWALPTPAELGVQVYHTIAAGAPIDFADYDLLWLHVGGRSAAVHARYCVSAAMSPGVPRASTIARLRKFVDAGGGMVLSGLAARLVRHLGLEAHPPNHSYWGTMIVPGHGPSRHRSAVVPKVKALGLRPVAPDHPLCAGLPVGGFQTMQFNPAELVTEAVWQRPPGSHEAWRSPSWPENGQVLAGYWADGIEIPADYAAAVAYETEGGGKVLLLGGAFDPRVSTNRPRRGELSDQLVRNAVAWCSG